MQPKYDRLNGLDSEPDNFDFICPICKEDGLKNPDLFNIHIIGAPYKPMAQENKDLPIEFAKYYNSLPTQRDILLTFFQDNDKVSLKVFCSKCGQIQTSMKTFNRVKLRKWADIHFPEQLVL